jgi:hypothetical protein
MCLVICCGDFGVVYIPLRPPELAASSFQADVACWHLTDQSGQTDDVRSSGAERTLREWLSTSEFDPGCVKTCTRRERAELFALFSSFDDDRQSASFLIQRNRDKLSTRKFDVGVFTQPGPLPDMRLISLAERSLDSPAPGPSTRIAIQSISEASSAGMLECAARNQARYRPPARPR